VLYADDPFKNYALSASIIIEETSGGISK